jgi:hypothetical protein
MSELRRGWVIDVDLEPTKGSERKAGRNPLASRHGVKPVAA